MSDASHIRQWLVSRAGAWRSVVQHVASLREQRRATVDEALGAVEAYRGLARDLATARRVAPNSRMTSGLESLYGQLHGVINRGPRGGIAALHRLLSNDIPKAAYELRARIASMALLMALSALAGWWLGRSSRSLSGVTAPEGFACAKRLARRPTPAALNSRTTITTAAITTSTVRQYVTILRKVTDTSAWADQRSNSLLSQPASAESLCESQFFSAVGAFAHNVQRRRGKPARNQQTDTPEDEPRQ